jgi:hypothetical protein
MSWIWRVGVGVGMEHGVAGVVGRHSTVVIWIDWLVSDPPCLLIPYPNSKCQSTLLKN